MVMVVMVVMIMIEVSLDIMVVLHLGDAHYHIVESAVYRVA